MLAAFFVLGLAHLTAVAAVDTAGAATDWGDARWLALHLAFVGGGASASSSRAPSPSPSGSRKAGTPWCWPARSFWPRGSRRSWRGCGAEAPLVAADPVGGAVVRACSAFLGLGGLAGVAMAGGATWPHGSLLGAPVALTLGGWFGTAILGTLHTFFRAARRSSPRSRSVTPAAVLLLPATWSWGHRSRRAPAGPWPVSGVVLVVLRRPHQPLEHSQQREHADDR